MFCCICVIYNTESFGIIGFRSEEVAWMDIYSMGCRVYGNRLVPNYNSRRRLPMKIRHGGYKLFVSFRIFFDPLEIGSIPGEYMAPSNWRIQVVFLGYHGFPSRIRGFRDSSIKRFHVIPINYDMWVDFI